MRKLVLALLAGWVSLTAGALTIDERIGNAMNAADWFALDSIYKAAPKDSIHPFLEVFARCLTGNRLNRPDVSIPAFKELLNSQSLDLGNLVSSTHMFGMDLSRQGMNAEAASMINSVVDQTRQYLDPATIDGLTASANRYAALARYNPYMIDMPESPEARVPFTIVPVGPKDKNSVLMHLLDSSINGRDADITFDTGAGANMISSEMAAKYDLTPLDGTRITVAGVDRREGCIAMANEIKLGDITIRDVPFVVVDLSSGNDEADKYIGCFNIVVGSELMLRLKDLTIDFTNRRIVVPATAPQRGDATPNLCFSNGMNLLAKGAVGGEPILMCIDSGDAAFGSLNAGFYETNKELVDRRGRPDTLRHAGIGGVSIMPCYYVPDLPVALGGTTVVPAELVVKTRDDGGYHFNLGLRTMMLFGKMRFNLVDFVLTTEPAVSAIAALPRHQAPAPLRFTGQKQPDILQTIGFIGVAVARSLLYPDPSGTPDL